MTWRYHEPDFLEDVPPPCYVEECRKPGRFFVGHGAIMYTYCIDHIAPRGVEQLMQTVVAIRDIIRHTPGLADEPHSYNEPGPNYHCVICDEPGAILCEKHR